MRDSMLIDIIVPLAISDTYTYRVPDSMRTPPIGVRVIVPLGKKQITGIVYRQHTGQLPKHVLVRDIIDILDTDPIITPEQFHLWEWIAAYYMCTLGEVMAAGLPAGIIDDNYTNRTTEYITLHPDYQTQEAIQTIYNTLNRAKTQQKLLQTFLSSTANLSDAIERRILLEDSGVSSAVLRTLIDKHILCQEQRTISRLRQYSGSTAPPHPLDEQQVTALHAICEQWEKTPITLLHGVTASGKTEIYIHLIAKALQKGKQVLYLVPEIALTTQLTERLQAIFGEQVLVYHSRFSNDERVEIYHKVGKYSTDEKQNGKLILGVRSAIFLPFSDLALVIVDEEHDPSYKQQDPAPRYHARSVAAMMSQLYGVKVLLGTATPSVETYHNALIGKYGLVEMPQRFQGLLLPKITIVDLQRQYHRKEMYGHFSDPVVFRMREELAKGKQVILFQNRRGYAPFLQCPNCGEVPHCGNCDVSMTYHKSNATLVCHSCGNTSTASISCPKCGTAWKLHGAGTERLEEEIQMLFPQARIARMDMDTTRRKDAYQQIIDKFAKHEVDILIGTQMVTKGLHFDDVSLVVVLQADTLVNQPHFRSTEQAFHMLEQVAGRAGRTGKQGEVMIQTFNPNNPLYQLVQTHHYAGLYTQQVKERQDFAFPPFYRLIMITLRHRDLQRLEQCSVALMNHLRTVFGNRVSQIITPLVARRQNQYIRHLRLRVEVEANIGRAKAHLRSCICDVLSQNPCKGTTITIDVDP
jgi:primosomal protein N' (replication factor Y)